MTNYTRFLVPLGLALAAAGANYMLVKKQVRKVEVLVVREDVAEGDAVTADKLGVVQIGADEKLFPNALKREDFGGIADLTVRRPLRAGEILFRTDLAAECAPLAAGEVMWHVEVRRPVTLYPGNPVCVYVIPPEGASKADRLPQSFGPYRFLGWQRSYNSSREPQRTYMLAVPSNDAQVLTARRWIATYRNAADAVAAIEPVTLPLAKPAAPR